MPRLALAIDLGGTNLRGAAVDESGAIISQNSCPTDAAEGVDAVIARIAQAIQDAAVQSGAGPDVAAGVAAPGPLDPRRGIVHFTPNLPGWYDVPLRERLEVLTGRPIYLGNDANAAALGELYFGAGKGLRNIIYIGLGTGVGGGVVSEGMLIDGLSGMGGELGHVSVSVDGPRCHCGGVGCIEAYCAAWSITDEARLLVRSGRGAAIVAAAGGDDIDPRAVGIAAAQGDPSALSLLHRAGTALGMGLANFINIFNPELIAIGGGLAEIGDPLLGPAIRAMEAHAMPVMRRAVRVTPSQLGAQTGIFGAAALVFHAGSV